jgi:hypothetical protein
VLVELDEIRASALVLADVNGDGQHRLRHWEDLVRSARALVDQDEAGEVGSGLGRDGYVFLTRQPADLDQGAGDQLRQLRRRVLGPHEGGADEDRVCAC